MQHRHLDTDEWTLEAIDSVLERGDLPDWRELFTAVRTDHALAAKVLHVARHHDLGGASLLACSLVQHAWPDLSSADRSG